MTNDSSPTIIPTGDTASAEASAPKTSGLAIAGFVLSFIPLVCINVVGVILAIVALVQISNKPKQLKGRGLAIAAIVIGCLWFVVGILAAIAIPNFIKFQSRAKQSEAKSNLKGIFVAEMAYNAEMDRYESSFRALNWEGQPGNRYTYYLADDVMPASAGPVESMPPGVESYVRGDGFKVVAVANIDGDDTLDVWTIDETNTLTNVSNDVTD